MKTEMQIPISIVAKMIDGIVMAPEQDRKALQRLLDIWFENDESAEILNNLKEMKAIISLINGRI